MSHCIFHDTDPADRDRCIFDLVEQAYGRGECVLVFVENEARAVAVDRMLWILKQESFIPHQIFRSHDPIVPVAAAIVTEEFNPAGAPILIADAHCSLDFACGFAWIHEFVTRSSPQVHEACRDRFRQYRARKIEVEHQKA